MRLNLRFVILQDLSHLFTLMIFFAIFILSFVLMLLKKYMLAK